MILKPETKFDFLTGEELKYLKTSNDDSNYDSPLVTLFDPDIFPYIVNKGIKKQQVDFVLTYHFSVFTKGKKNAIKVFHRNRSGVLFVENGYYGKRPEDRDYYLIIQVKPDFTNEHYVYSPRVCPKIISDFNTKMLDSIANQVIDVWDKAIENNARHWGGA